MSILPFLWTLCPPLRALCEKKQSLITKLTKGRHKEHEDQNEFYEHLSRYGQAKWSGTGRTA